MRQHQVTLYTCLTLFLDIAILASSCFLCVHIIRQRESLFQKNENKQAMTAICASVNKIFSSSSSKNSSDLPLISFIGFSIWDEGLTHDAVDVLKFSFFCELSSMEFKMVCFINDYLMTICVLLRPPEEILC